MDIHNDVCVLSVMGTAVRMSLRTTPLSARRPMRRRPHNHSMPDLMLGPDGVSHVPASPMSPLMSPGMDPMPAPSSYFRSASNPTMQALPASAGVAAPSDDPTQPQQQGGAGTETSVSVVGGPTDPHDQPRASSSSPSISTPSTRPRGMSKASIHSSVGGGAGEGVVGPLSPPLSSRRVRLSSVGSLHSEASTGDVRFFGDSGAPMSTSAAHNTYSRRAQRRRTRYVQRGCSFMHVPYRHKSGPFEHMKLALCRECGRKWVPETLLSSLEPPRSLRTVGPPVMVEARVCQRKDQLSGESECVDVSQLLIFIEYDLHRQFLLKLRACGRNAAFALRMKLHFQASMVVATMSATAVFVAALPPPPSVTLRRFVVVVAVVFVFVCFCCILTARLPLGLVGLMLLY